jgi:hypothetical protein
MRQAISATIALAVVIVVSSEPTYALTNADCKRAGGTVTPSTRLDFKSASHLMKGKQGSLVSF